MFDFLKSFDAKSGEVFQKDVKEELIKICRELGNFDFDVGDVEFSVNLSSYGIEIFGKHALCDRVILISIDNCLYKNPAFTSLCITDFKISDRVFDFMLEQLRAYYVKYKELKSHKCCENVSGIVRCEEVFKFYEKLERLLDEEFVK